MATSIHNTAIIAPTAQLGKNVSVGAYSIIEDDVIIGDNTKIAYHCVIGKRATIGANNNIFSSVVIGSDPQDLKYNGEPTRVTIGNDNLIHEFVTISNGTGENGHTIVGNNNCILAYCHIAHDDHYGNGIVMSNAVQLAGHVTVEDGVTFGGCAAIHQFCTIGKYSMIAANAILVKDATPFSLISREPSYHGINAIGLRRHGFSIEVRTEIKRFYEMTFHSGMNNSDAIRKYIDQVGQNNILPEVQYCIDFINSSQRGVIR